MTAMLLLLGGLCLLGIWLPALRKYLLPRTTPPGIAWTRGAGGVLGLLLLIVGGLWVTRHQAVVVSDAKFPDSTSHVTRCANCHSSQAEQFLETGHARTLSRADQTSAGSHFAGQSVRLGDPAIEFRYRERDGRLWFESDRKKSPSPVDWIFGSGQHGQTPVSVRVDDHGDTIALDHHVTWYAEHGLALTIGRPADVGQHIADVGNPNDPSTTQKCFGCHTTVLPMLGDRLNLDQCVPGIFCSRCHAGADQHAQAMDAGRDVVSFDNWQKRSPLESVSRCGECHGLPRELAPHELTPKNMNLPRFASIGLLLSKCFQLQHTRSQADGSTARLDCVTCHDPHRSGPKETNQYNRSCRECHRRGSENDSDCPQQPLDSHCIGCHMPKVRMNSPVHFTDHWIRVRANVP